MEEGRKGKPGGAGRGCEGLSGEEATGVERATSTFVKLEHGGLPGTDDDGLVCQASKFGLDPGSEGQPRERLAEGRT